MTNIFFLQFCLIMCNYFLVIAQRNQKWNAKFSILHKQFIPELSQGQIFEHSAKSPLGMWDS